MRSLQVSVLCLVIAVCSCFFALVALAHHNHIQKSDILLKESRSRRRLALSDPKSVEYKIGFPTVTEFHDTWTTSNVTQQETIQTHSSPGNTQTELSATVSIVATTEPSYVQLCHELIRRTADDGSGSKEDAFVVHESPDTCSSLDSFTSLTHIMLSAAIAQAGSKARLRYQHNCSIKEKTPQTIQQWLPQDLAYGVGIGQSQIREKCISCLSSNYFTQCMGMPVAGVMSASLDPMTTSFRIAGFRQNIQKAVQALRKSYLLRQVSSPTYGGAVIVLDLDNETSGQAWALPIYFYEELLPKDVTSIAILTARRCIQTIPTCKHHGETLTSALRKRYPTAKIHSEIVASTSVAYARIMDAQQLICPSSVFCILPSMFHEYSKSSHHVMNSNLYEWFKYVARENRKLMGKQIQIFEPSDVQTIWLPTNAEELDTFLYAPRPEPHRIRRRLSSLNDPKTVVYKPASHPLSPGSTSENMVPAYGSSAPQNSLDPEVPSYIHLCTELLSRRESMRSEPLFVVHESPAVCSSTNSFQSLITMLISAVIASAGSRLRISYLHNCAYPDNIATATIQQLLPPTLSIAHGIGIDAAFDRCHACLAQPLSDARSMVECFGFPVAGPMSSDPEGSAIMLPPFRHNIEAAVHKTNLLEAESRPPTNAGVVVYLDTDSEVGTDVYQVPMKYYADIIPRDISTISILVSARCTKCNDLSVFIKEYLHLMYPLAAIDVEFVSGSAIAYARVMAAPLTICSPSMFCLLPSLFKEFSHKSHIILHPNLYPWFKSLAIKTDNRLNKSVFLSEGQSVRPLHALKDMEEFLEEQADPGSAVCVNLRGRLGEWTQDLEYAKQAQYVTPLKRFRSFDFIPTPEMPYRLATTYKWVDALCPVFVTEKNRLCTALHSLGLSRIYIVGDSLGMQMAQSLWKLLGNEDDPYTTKAERFQWTRKVECPNNPSGFEIVYTRNDLLNDNDEKDLHFRIGDKSNCGIAEFCLPWIRNYAEFSSSSTLLITNVGTHVHDIDLFREYVDSFFDMLDRVRKPKDVIMFRTTPPGHENCQDATVAPIRNYDEFVQKYFISDFKSYHLFPTYNKLAEERVRDRSGIYVLDVVPMTILRPDGHTSGPQKCSTCKADDCLHYMLPGPTDWWNHLMFSNLISLATSLDPSTHL